MEGKKEKYVYEISAEGQTYTVVSTSYHEAIERWLREMRVNRQIDEGFIYGISRSRKPIIE